MMISLEDMNAFLAKLGSSYHATPNEHIGPALSAIFAALPEYIEREIDRKVAIALEANDKAAEKAK